MHVRTALHTRENGAVDEGGDVLERFFRLFERVAHRTFREDEAAARAPQGFVRGGGNNMKTVVERVFSHAARYEACDVCHVGHKQRAHLFAYGRELLIVQLARVSGKTSQDDFWFVRGRQLPQLVVVYLAR